MIVVRHEPWKTIGPEPWRAWGLVPYAGDERSIEAHIRELLVEMAVRR